MKRSMIYLAGLTMAILALTVFAGCDKDDSGAITGATTAPSAVSRSFLPGNDITPEELKAMLHIREEEKLARDVYIDMYNRWQLRIFNNIQASEQVHIDAMIRAMNRYNIPDSAGGLDTGKFNDPALQALYDELIAQGSATAGAALAVGVRIEELDIADLQAAIALPDNQDLLQVYGNLLQGSQRHLAAFRGPRLLPANQ
jgi:hypothetical protein